MDPFDLLPSTALIRVLAESSIVVSGEEVASRRASLAADFPSVPGSQLKQAEPQTIAALTVLANPMIRPTTPCTDWGVVVGAENLGRHRLNEVVPRFQAGGAWSVTPHFIPHCLLHAPAGLVAQALGCRGPTLGVGGTSSDSPTIAEQALLAATAWIATGDCPAVCVVCTTDSMPIHARAWIIGGNPKGRDQ